MIINLCNVLGICGEGVVIIYSFIIWPLLELLHFTAVRNIKINLALTGV